MKVIDLFQSTVISTDIKVDKTLVYIVSVNLLILLSVVKFIVFLSLLIVTLRLVMVKYGTPLTHTR